MSTLDSRTSTSPIHESALYGAELGRRVTFRDLLEAKVHGQHWPMLTSYDAITARLFDSLGVPVLLVGDSVGHFVAPHFCAYSGARDTGGERDTPVPRAA